ncbi:MAG TPA: DNA replication/repair protein RecF [Geobacteraceae bacterium]|nr:DNA replication/repair protein RecF [Geobacteraceae bacterium]
MKLHRIQIHSFRNIVYAELIPCERFNIIVGNNAQGKTNILESVFLLGTMKSFRMVKNADLITYGSPYAIIKGWGQRDGVVREIALSISNSGKKAFVDQKPVVRPTDFFGTINTVVFSPEDIAMVRGVPEMRRRYLDRAIFSGDTGYLSVHHEYFRILKQRNALLKQGEADGLPIWSERLADAGARLMEKRESFIGEISRFFTEYYCSIAGPGHKAKLRYCSRITETDRTRESLCNALYAALEKSAHEELRRGTTLIGPHRDDLECILNDKPLNHHGSQGEQRSFILALKMAEIEYLRNRWGNPPILLLDDMTSELDRNRNGNLMDFLKEKDMQVFITTTSLDNINLVGISNYSTFPVQEGRVLSEVTNV